MNGASLFAGSGSELSWIAEALGEDVPLWALAVAWATARVSCTHSISVRDPSIWAWMGLSRLAGVHAFPALVSSKVSEMDSAADERTKDRSKRSSFDKA